MKKNQKSFRRKLVENAKKYEFLTLGTLAPYPLARHIPPIWPLPVIALGALRKMVFVPGESAPIYWRYGSLKFSELTFRAHFGGLWPPNPSSESSPTDTFHRSWIVLCNGEKKIDMSLLCK